MDGSVSEEGNVEKKANLVRLSSYLGNGDLWIPEQLFQESIERVRKEFPELTKAMAIFYIPAEDRIYYSQCGMKLTDTIRMLSRLHDELIFDLIEANL